MEECFQALLSRLAEIRTLTQSLNRSAERLDIGALEEGLEQRRLLLSEVEQLQKQIESEKMPQDAYKTKKEEMLSLLAVLREEDKRFVETIGEKKKELGETIAHLRRQQKEGHFYHGGSHGY